MKEFTIYTSNTKGESSNCIYSNCIKVNDDKSFLEAIKNDHVCGTYKSNRRSKDNFISSDVIPMDCDNDHSEKEEDWITEEDVSNNFCDVCYFISYSRNHMKEKGGKKARPRFHVYFAISKITNADEYTSLKQKICLMFPYFDSNAVDSARFIYGTDNTNLIMHDREKTIDEVLVDDFEEFDSKTFQIEEGSRNSTMSHIAGKLIKRYGNTAECYELFRKEAEKCNPPLEDIELDTIWNSATKFGEKVSNQEGYISPEIYNSDCTLKPGDFSDVGQAVVIAKEYKDRLRYSPSTDFLVYNGSYWEESGPKSQGISQELTERQLDEANKEIEKYIEEMKKNGALNILITVGEKKAPASFNEKQRITFEKYLEAKEYRKYAIKRRDSKYVTSALRETKPMLEMDHNILDKNEFLLNCPSMTINLKTKEKQEHIANDYITKQTLVDPSNEGMDIWLDAINTFFEGDKELIDYVQKIVGLASIGKVYVEALIIAYGEGRNGKSTFWNAISKVLGTYSGNLSADMLTVGCRRNVKPELAEAKGKRILIAAELEEGMRLNTSNVKQLCSTDEIYAEKKFKDPFSYTPTHTLVLYTNHLPKVGALDKGTWRRLIVIPFNAKLQGSSEIKNYGDYLVEKAGGAILSWIIEGANKVIKESYKFALPSKVQNAINIYRESNDWLAQFLNERCEVGDEFIEKSGDVYRNYRTFCSQINEFARSTTDFYAAIENAGFSRKKLSKGNFINGLRLKSDFLD